MIQFLEDLKGQGKQPLTAVERDELETLRKDQQRLRGKLAKKKKESGKKGSDDSDSGSSEDSDKKAKKKKKAKGEDAKHSSDDVRTSQ